MRTISTIGITLAAIFLFLLPSQARGGNAAFSANGKAIYVLRHSRLFTLDSAFPEQEAIAVNIDFGDGDIGGIKGISLDREGDLLLLRKHAIWRWTPDKPNAEKNEDLSKDVNFSDIACSPDGDETILSANSDLYWKKDHNTKTLKLEIRRPPGCEISCPVFWKDGTFFFSADGDIWRGEVFEGHWLVATRYAPIAIRETSDGSGGETGVNALVVGDGKLYSNFSRTHASGWGALIAIDLQQGESKKRTDDSKDSIMQSLISTEHLAKALNSVKILRTNDGTETKLCASHDGRVIYYATKGANGVESIIMRNGELIDLQMRR